MWFINHLFVINDQYSNIIALLHIEGFPNVDGLTYLAFIAGFAYRFGILPVIELFKIPIAIARGFDLEGYTMVATYKRLFNSVVEVFNQNIHVWKHRYSYSVTPPTPKVGTGDLSNITLDGDTTPKASTSTLEELDTNESVDSPFANYEDPWNPTRESKEDLPASPLSTEDYDRYFSLPSDSSMRTQVLKGINQVDHGPLFKRLWEYNSLWIIPCTYRIIIPVVSTIITSKFIIPTVIHILN